jgi:hypothetical protein
MRRSVLPVTVFVAGALVMTGCGAAQGSLAQGQSMPSPSDTASRIMSTTGPGFTICGVDGAVAPYSVTVCGDVGAARAVLDAQFPGKTSLVPYRPDDSGPHTPDELVLQYWVNHTSGSGFTIVTTRITGDGSVSVGVDGDMEQARAILDQRFPGMTTVHPQPSVSGGVPDVVVGQSPGATGST